MRFYDLNNKVFNVVADQAANMKKALEAETAAAECDEIQLLINDLLLQQKKEDLKKKEAILREQLETEILEANTIVELDSSKNKLKFNRTETLNELMLDDSLEDITDPTDDLDSSSDTLKDADEEKATLETLIDDFIADDQISMKYSL